MSLVSSCLLACSTYKRYLRTSSPQVPERRNISPGALLSNHMLGGPQFPTTLHAGFSTQQRGVKPWRPLFYWLLDTTIINAFRLSEHQRKATLGSAKDKVQSVYRA